MYTELKDLYYRQLLRLDLELTQLISEPDASRDRWRELNRFALNELAEIVDRVIADLAGALGLKEVAPTGQ
jgi:hypothetical protein